MRYQADIIRLKNLYCKVVYDCIRNNIQFPASYAAVHSLPFYEKPRSVLSQQNPVRTLLRCSPESE
jgi:hypothetical protein